MGILDRSRLKNALDTAKDKHGDKMVRGVEKAGELIDDKTGGKHKAKIDKGVRKTKDALHREGGSERPR